MHEISYFRTLFASNRVHVSETLLEPALKHFNHNFPLSEEKFR